MLLPNFSYWNPNCPISSLIMNLSCLKIFRKTNIIFVFLFCDEPWFATFRTQHIVCDFIRFTFYDGPPFATGLPHYGHILAGTIKDVVTRWAHQTGHHVERRFGWDTHGLPVVRLSLKYVPFSLEGNTDFSQSFDWRTKIEIWKGLKFKSEGCTKEVWGTYSRRNFLKNRLKMVQSE